jgi:PEP-CTERM motif
LIFVENGFNYSQEGNLNKTNSNPIQGNKPMKIIILTIITALALNLTAFAEIGIVETTANINNGATNVYASTVGAASNPRWAGLNLGTFDLNAGATLALNNFYFENYAWNGGNVPAGGQYNNNWLATESTATFKLYRDSTLLNTTSMRQAAVNGSNRNWDLNASGVNINILDGLTGNGTYNLSWTIDWTYNQWSGSAVVVGTTQSSSDGNATFSTIPEPSSSLLMGFGLAGLAVLRRTRKNA